MNTKIKPAYLGLIGLCAMFALLAPESRSEAWKSFESRAERFRVCYPASWNRVALWGGEPINEDHLDIINFPNSERLKGVLLIAAGAEIQVGSAPSDVTTIEGWISRGTELVEKLNQREIPIRTTAKHG